MFPDPKAFEKGSDEARRDISAGSIRLRYGVAGEWGRDIKDSLHSRFGVELVELSCFVTDESRSFDAGYNAVVEAHIDGIFGSGSVGTLHQEVQARRKERYDKHFGSKSAA
jgi:hypothetical protein